MKYFWTNVERQRRERKIRLILKAFGGKKK